MRLTHLSFSYERSLKPARSIEFKIGILGIGKKPEGVAKLGGAFTRVGYKVMLSPEYYKRKGKEPHLLKGLYLRPEINLGYFKETLFTYNYTSAYFWMTQPETKVTFFAVMFNAGNQWIIADDYLIDLFVGAGFGGNSGKRREVNYAVLGPSPLFLNAGLKFGVLFK